MATTQNPLTSRFALLGLAIAQIPLSQLSWALLVFLITFTALIPITVGIPLFAGAVVLTRAFADAHRSLAGTVLGTRVTRPYRALPKKGLFARLRGVFGDPATWRDFAWLWVNGVVGLLFSLFVVAFFFGSLLYLTLPAWMPLWQLAGGYQLWINVRITTVEQAYWVMPLGAVFLTAWWWFAPKLMRANAQIAAALLGPTQGALLQRVSYLTQSRAETVDAHAAELRRIERDLHDGAQARLVALGMSLGMAEEVVHNDPAGARELLAEARQATTTALAELRDLVRGIHPPVLADRGLDGAVQALALANPIPVEVTGVLPGRPQAPVESAVYFAVAESLANMLKHSGAASGWIRLSYEDGQLAVLIGDDGRGGALVTPGGGLHGIQRRLAAFDGTLLVTSPAGGPTVLSVTVPCALSAPVPPAR